MKGVVINGLTVTPIVIIAFIAVISPILKVIMCREMSSLKQLIFSIKNLSLFEESLIYLEILWGLHPEKQNIPAKLKFWTYVTVFATFFALCLMVLITKWNGIEAMGKTDLISPCYQIIFTAVFYKFNLNSVSVLLEDLKQFWEVNSIQAATLHSNLKSISKKVIIYVYFYKICILFGISQYYIKPFLSIKPQLSTDWYEICNLKDIRCYYLSLFIQYYCLFILVWNIFTFDGIFASLVLKVFQQLKMIKYKIENMNFDKELGPETSSESLSNIVDHHDFLLTYIDHMNQFYSKILLSQVSSCIFSLCIGSFLLTSNETLGLKHVLDFIFYLASLFLQIFIYCFGGQVILNECEAILDSIYEINWWAANVEMQENILLMLIRSQKLGRITVGGITDVNLKVYLYVSRTAFSFYTLMNQLYKKEMGKF